jgi:hypothetical protein
MTRPLDAPRIDESLYGPEICETCGKSHGANVTGRFWTHERWESWRKSLRAGRIKAQARMAAQKAERQAELEARFRHPMTARCTKCPWEVEGLPSEVIPLQRAHAAAHQRAESYQKVWATRREAALRGTESDPAPVAGGSGTRCSRRRYRRRDLTRA